MTRQNLLCWRMEKKRKFFLTIYNLMRSPEKPSATKDS
jgi:hypothetical protein